MGFTPSLFAACLVIRTQAAAPSFRVLALAAVIVPPSFKNTVGTEPNFSKLAFLYSSSSLTTVSGLPRFPDMVTGTISLAKTPAFAAASLLL
uniref:Putative secreted protein n=1 Tax=Ixodes ricinus TaxID=34613 RepID=A0A6B0U413_IXORI